MAKHLERIADLGVLAGLLLYPGLILTTLWEVVARYAFKAPTIWAFDAVFMQHGALFMLSGAFALKERAHIRIDVFSTRLPARVQHAVNLICYLGLFLPAIWFLGDATIRRTYFAINTGEVELLSAWGPLLWPLFLALSAGIVLLVVQSLVECYRHLSGIVSGRPLQLSAFPD